MISVVIISLGGDNILIFVLHRDLYLKIIVILPPPNDTLYDACVSAWIKLFLKYILLHGIPISLSAQVTMWCHWEVPRVNMAPGYHCVQQTCSQCPVLYVM